MTKDEIILEYKRLYDKFDTAGFGNPELVALHYLAQKLTVKGTDIDAEKIIVKELRKIIFNKTNTTLQ